MIWTMNRIYRMGMPKWRADRICEVSIGFVFLLSHIPRETPVNPVDKDKLATA